MLDKIKLLTKWVAQYKALDAAWDKIYRVTGADCESELGRATFEIFDTYTDTLADLIGAHREDLHWFLYDNECGAKQIKAGAVGKMRKIKNIKDLIKLIEEI